MKLLGATRSALTARSALLKRAMPRAGRIIASLVVLVALVATAAALDREPPSAPRLRALLQPGGLGRGLRRSWSNVQRKLHSFSRSLLQGGDQGKLPAFEQIGEKVRVSVQGVQDYGRE